MRFFALFVKDVLTKGGLTAKIIKSTIMQQFKCLAADCPDTCCKVWQMQVDAKTIDLYKEKAPELLESIEMDAASQKTVMKRAENSFCVKFSNGICGIHKEYGENFLGDACYFYPRVTRKLGEKIYMSAALSCPETVRLAVIEGKSGWAESESERLPESMKNYLDEKLPADVHETPKQLFKAIAGCDSGLSSICASLLRVAISMDELPRENWAEVVSGLIADEAVLLLPASGEIYKILNTFVVLVYGAKIKISGRLQEAIEKVQQELGIIMDFDNARILAGRGGPKNLEEIRKGYAEISPRYEKILRGYLLASLEFSLFPFAGLGHTVFEKAAIIIFRIALMRVFILSSALEGSLSDDEIVKIIQSVSRVIDHLESEELLLKVFEDSSWKSAEDFLGLLCL